MNNGEIWQDRISKIAEAASLAEEDPAEGSEAENQERQKTSPVTALRDGRFSMSMQIYRCGNRITAQLLAKRLGRQGLDVKDPEQKGPIWVVKAKDPKQRSEKTPEVATEVVEPQVEPEAPEKPENAEPEDEPKVEPEAPEGGGD